MSIGRFASKSLAIATLITGFWEPETAYAATWSSTNVHYLYGWNFEPTLSKEDHGTVALEHASGFAYGDNFFFLDVSNGVLEDNTVASTLYGQWNPRFSLSKITGMALAMGPDHRRTAHRRARLRSRRRLLPEGILRRHRFRHQDPGLRLFRPQLLAAPHGRIR